MSFPFDFECEHNNNNINIIPSLSFSNHFEVEIIFSHTIVTTITSLIILVHTLFAHRIWNQTN